jgi:hypothetical protein
MKKKWEYKVIGFNGSLKADENKRLERRLNELGDDGWELVEVLDKIDSGFTVEPRVYSNFIILKREKDEI